MAGFVSSLSRRTGAGAAVGGLRYDWWMAVLGALFVGGLYLDGWAHNHGRVDQSFFTPWHAFFYGGFVLTAAFLFGALGLNRARGVDWSEAVPAGYAPALAGALIFAAGGIGDLIWHELFGIEEDLEALLSPTHLLLGVGLALVVSGPMRAAWRRSGEQRSLAEQGPVLISAALTLSTLTFFIFYIHPLGRSLGGARHSEMFTDLGQAAAILGIYVSAALFTGMALFLLRRWQPAPGAFSLIFALNALGMGLVDSHHWYWWVLALVQVAAGLGADLLVWRLRPAPARRREFYLFAFLMPALYFALYFAALATVEGLAWSIHLWAGSIAQAGVVGLLLAALAAPPALPDDIER